MISKPKIQNPKSKIEMGFPILTYHSIDESGSVISTAPGVFRRQMRFLRENDYRVVSLSRFVEDLSENDILPEKTVVLTFDDGFQNFYAEAFPVLDEYGFAATVFLVTDYCGKYNDWAGNPPELPRSRMLSWREIKELSAKGIEFGAHTKTHPDLTKTANGKIKIEIAESKAAIENALGEPAETFAYPYGKFDDSVKEIAGKYFKAACSTNLGKVRAGSDLFSLERLDAYYLSNPKIFSSLSTRSFDRYIYIRRLMRNFKAIVRNH
jgi:peptidoglycan/xylan/chitin deacetylase (PgdA/CDA1 family)